MTATAPAVAICAAWAGAASAATKTDVATHRKNPSYRTDATEHRNGPSHKTDTTEHRKNPSLKKDGNPPVNPVGDKCSSVSWVQ